jgi:hypothetical protein
MARPTIGHRPMTPAERQRRSREMRAKELEPSLGERWRRASEKIWRGRQDLLMILHEYRLDSSRLDDVYKQYQAVENEMYEVLLKARHRGGVDARYLRIAVEAALRVAVKSGKDVNIHQEAAMRGINSNVYRELIAELTASGDYERIVNEVEADKQAELDPAPAEGF